MREQIEHAKEVISAAASNPKIALAAGVGIPGASTAANTLGLINGWVGTVTGCLAMCTGAVVLAIQLLKLSRDWRDYRRRKK